MSKPSILVLYRLVQDTEGWEVRWLCGRDWLRVCGPTQEDRARLYLDYISKMPL